MPQLLCCSYSLHEIHTLTKQLLILAKKEPSKIFALYGPLGAGKTTLIKTIIASLLDISPLSIKSPTFSYVHTYKTTHTIHHFDLYRIKTRLAFESLGFTDYLNQTCFIEWPEIIEDILPKNTVRIHVSHKSPLSRSYKTHVNATLEGNS